MDDVIVEEYAKEDCGCGHRFHAGACRHSHRVTDLKALPEPTFDNPAHPMEYPNNWPPALLVPTIEIECGCASFHAPEPEPPEESYRLADIENEELGR